MRMDDIVALWYDDSIIQTTSAQASQNTASTFQNLGIAEKLLAVLTRRKFIIPTPIQHQVISVALKGKDIVGIAQTGTGKTLAFGIPMIQRLVEGKG